MYYEWISSVSTGDVGLRPKHHLFGNRGSGEDAEVRLIACSFLIGLLPMVAVAVSAPGSLPRDSCAAGPERTADAMLLFIVYLCMEGSVQGTGRKDINPHALTHLLHQPDTAHCYRYSTPKHLCSHRFYDSTDHRGRHTYRFPHSSKHHNTAPAG